MGGIGGTYKALKFTVHFAEIFWRKNRSLIWGLVSFTTTSVVLSCAHKDSGTEIFGFKVRPLRDVSAPVKGLYLNIRFTSTRVESLIGRCISTATCRCVCYVPKHNVEV